MKKFGFTLAEVLITLAIIGFIASVTLPSLTTGVGDRQSIVAFKKSINSLTNTAQMAQALDGVDYGMITSTGEFRNSILTRANTERTLGNIDVKIGTVTQSKNTTEITSGTNRAIFFRDGTALIFPDTSKVNDTTKNMKDDITTTQDDGLPKGFGAVIDINGTKGPNSISYCGDSNSIKTFSTCDSKRKILDQFPIKIRGSVIVPNNAAARWALMQ